MPAQDTKEQRQREALRRAHGEPTLGIDFIVYPGAHVSMWFHVNHAQSFTEVNRDVMAIRDKLDEFIKDREMCPFNPDFTGLDISAPIE